MATVREQRIFTTEEVLELLEGDDDNTQIDYDSSESEIEDDGDGAVFPENSVGNRDISGESASSLEEENESSSESEMSDKRGQDNFANKQYTWAKSWFQRPKRCQGSEGS